uniref:Small EDRK-rich factor-like N-terminal domain-containing protein n=1 Tax=Pseudonaja textilis TaxID=8673 RepID=A0A670Z0A8_PSETE
MAHGNQRELSRQKSMKKIQEQNKGKRKEDALSQNNMWLQRGSNNAAASQNIGPKKTYL